MLRAQRHGGNPRDQALHGSERYLSRGLRQRQAGPNSTVDCGNVVCESILKCDIWSTKTLFLLHDQGERCKSAVGSCCRILGFRTLEEQIDCPFYGRIASIPLAAVLRLNLRLRKQLHPAGRLQEGPLLDFEPTRKETLIDYPPTSLCHMANSSRITQWARLVLPVANPRDEIDDSLRRRLPEKM